MLLAVNVGNTNLALGVFDGTSLLYASRTPLHAPPDDLWAVEGWRDCRDGVSEIAVAGVNPPRQRQFIEWAAQSFGSAPLAAGRDFSVPLRNRCTPPGNVGIDRLLNAYAASRLHGGDAVVVDFGTAMSFSVVSGEGDFLGGAIAPGLGMMARALSEQTQALPEVSPRKVDEATGRTTEHAINAGLRWGASGMLDRILEGLLGERPAGTRILGTGGDLDWFLQFSRYPIEPHPHLTLQGLMFAFNHHREGKRDE